MRAFALARRSLVATALVAAVVPTALAGSAQAAEGRVDKPAGGEVVDGRYVVSLKEPAGLAKAATAEAVAARYGGKVERVYQSALAGFAVSATEKQARRLAADPRVARVEADSVVRATATRPNAPWNLDRVDQRSMVLNNAYNYPDSAGEGVTVYVLDTGVRTSHAEFGGRASVGFDAIGDSWKGQDCSTTGHGTHVAGTVAGTTFGVANKAKIVSVRVLSCDNVGSVSQIVAGIDWVTANAKKPAVVNMSLGGSRSEIEEAALKRSIDAGITYVASAGNWESNACSYSPAAYPDVITVGASNPADERASGWTGSGAETGSNYGSCVDLFAPGEAIKSAHNATNNATVVLRGTSMASPHVAGAAALYLAQNPTATPAEVTRAVVGRATEGVLKQSTLKSGSPNKFLYIGPADAVCSVSNDNRQAVPDRGTVTSAVEVGSCGRKVAENASVRVRAEHPFRGDLSLRLVAPNGAEVELKAADSADTATDLDRTYPINLSAVDANGTWKLVVRDNFDLDEGALLGWTLNL
ncbi:S8 family peptidase [Streptoalloteichus hindustanus]|uniref:Serine protease, subtilisin family n=1 Tax=Streptoalloteichus hindustanus TaxID=2017 RepID=A0A1M5MV24_STRHI|nr:S8 family peptidase [Streptoalloteichus hindustanus]SHG81027.1 Serine protease, subtilisin family [Streptoalloteichus hindustanus]